MADKTDILVEILNETAGTKKAVEHLAFTLAQILEVLQEIKSELRKG